MNSGTSPKLLTWLRQAFRRLAPSTASKAATAATEDIPLLTQLRLAREGLASVADGSHTTTVAIRALARLEARMPQPPRVAVFGEFNIGKSSLVNLMLGGALPQGGVLPDVRVPILFRYGDKPALFQIASDGHRRAVAPGSVPPGGGATAELLEVYLPLNLLRRIEIIDVPGIGNPVHDASELLPKIARSVHLVLWCTSATQAWKGSEQRVWLALPQRLRAASLLVVTHADRLREDADREKVLDRLRRETGAYFRGAVLVSTKQLPLPSRHSVPGPDIASRQAEYWQANGGALFWSNFYEAISAVAAAREQSAARAAKRIAAWVAARLAAPRQTGDSARLLAMWSTHADTLAAHVTDGAPVNEAALAEFARGISRFASDTLAPWLDSHCDASQSRQVMELFRCDPTKLAEAIDGLPREFVVQRLHGVLQQLQEELEESIGTKHSQLSVSHELPPKMRTALKPLFELARE